MAYSFENPKKKRKGEAVSLTEDQREYREREKREEERYKLATDADTSICFCFHDADEMGLFARFAEADDEGFCYGDVLRRLLTERIGVRKVKSFKPKPIMVGVFPDPFEGLEVTDDLEADCFAEAEALLKAFESLERKPYYRIVWDSAYYVTAIFRDHVDKANFIADFALAKFGETFMDGAAVLKYIGIEP